tara:strand:- start:1125 stop:1739 length:615 start_codon:yes stop_codon:yes gene_type:complete
MSTYTPTHCPETGRKFTKAERKAANQAKYAAERTVSKPKTKRKPKAVKAVKVAKVTLTDEAKLLKMTKKQLVALILFPEPTPTPTPKVKAKAKAKRKATPAIKRPKRSSEAGMEQAQARASVGVGTPKKTKVVDAATGGKAEVFKTRMAVPVEEPKARKKEMMRVTLLPGEDVLTAVRRVKIQAEQAAAEASRLEAEALLNGEA